MPSRARMAAIAFAARGMEGMAQLALLLSECKSGVAGTRIGTRKGKGRGSGQHSAFHSGGCGKLVIQFARGAMHVRILLQVTGNDGSPGATDEIAAFEKTVERPEDLGLSLAEGKALTAAIQRHVVEAQVASW